jgi:hypothetical protein
LVTEHGELNIDTGDPGPVPRGRRRPRRVAVALLAVLGVCAIGGGAAGLVTVHDRKPAAAQVTAAGQAAFAQQWRRLAAGQIFPATVSYTSELGDQTTATRVGIAPQAPCDAAVDPGVARVLESAGCVAVLRATYTDESRTAVTTVGVVVMRSSAGAASAYSAIVRKNPGDLLPVSFPGTIAAGFTRKARENDGEQQAGGPYLVFYTAGYADGRDTSNEQAGNDDSSGETVTDDLPTGIVTSLLGTFTPPASPCDDRDVRC